MNKTDNIIYNLFKKEWKTNVYNGKGIKDILIGI